jgi:hypothetical protein
VLRAARARWFTTLLIFWAAYREFVPSARSARSSESDSGTGVVSAPAVHSALRAAPAPFPNARDLVVVCGHAVFVGGDFTAAAAALESSWFLEPYQRTPGQAAALVEHMRTGVLIASKNEHSILLFSGGTTRAAAGSLSEATSYYLVSRASRWFGAENVHVANRAFTEERARDSYENVLFSIARFHELTGHTPRHLTGGGVRVQTSPFPERALDRAAVAGGPLRVRRDAVRERGARSAKRGARKDGSIAIRGRSVRVR